MTDKMKDLSSDMHDASEDVLHGEISDSRHDAVFGEITEEGPDYRSVGAPASFSRDPSPCIYTG